MEVCLSNENTDKLHGDQGKLSREGKTNTSVLYQICDEKSHVKLWVIQASGLRAFFSTVVYTGNNLFVLIPQFHIQPPTCTGQLKDFTDSISKLLFFKDEILKIRHIIDAKLEAERNARNTESLSSVY